MQLILIAGGHFAGKETIATSLASLLGHAIVKIIALDDYIMADASDIYSPKKYDFERVISDIDAQNADVVVVHGLYALYSKELVARAAMKVFVDCDADVRLNRMASEAIRRNPSSLKDVIELYLNKQRGEFNAFIAPTKEAADVVLPSEHPATGVDLICDGIQGLLKGEAPHKVNKTLYPREDLLKRDEKQFYELS